MNDLMMGKFITSNSVYSALVRFPVLSHITFGGAPLMADLPKKISFESHNGKAVFLGKLPDGFIVAFV